MNFVVIIHPLTLRLNQNNNGSLGQYDDDARDPAPTCCPKPASI